MQARERTQSAPPHYPHGNAEAGPSRPPSVSGAAEESTGAASVYIQRERPRSLSPRIALTRSHGIDADVGDVAPAISEALSAPMLSTSLDLQVERINGDRQSPQENSNPSQARHIEEENVLCATQASSLEDPERASNMDPAGPERLSPVVMPPQRTLRARKAAQMNPYTVEMALYRRRLVRNDWEDAVVTDAQWRRRIREEKERAAANDLPSGLGNNIGRRRQRQGSEQSGRSNGGQVDDQRLEVLRREVQPNVKDTSPVRQSTGQSTSMQRDIFAVYGGSLTDSEQEDAALHNLPGKASHLQIRQNGKRRLVSHNVQPTESYKQSSAAEISDASNSDHSDTPTRGHKRSRKRLSSSSMRLESGSFSKESDAEPDPDVLKERRDRSNVSPLSSSSDDTIDYEHEFRQLKRMMPIGMARKYINDLKNMRKGKAYHSDGHVSATPEPDSADEETPGNSLRSSISSQIAPGHGQESLRPGETRRRLRHGADLRDARFDLTGDSDSSSNTEIGITPSTSEDGHSDDAPIDEMPSRLHPPSARVPTEDAIDRMLSRAQGQRRGNRSSGRTGRAMDSAATRTRLSKAPNRSASPRIGRSMSALGSTRPSKDAHPRRRKRRKQSARSDRSRVREGVRAVHRAKLLSNPPVVQPRMRRLIDLDCDDIFFDVSKHTHVALSKDSESSEGQAVVLEQRDEQHNVDARTRLFYDRIRPGYRHFGSNADTRNYEDDVRPGTPMPHHVQEQRRGEHFTAGAESYTPTDQSGSRTCDDSLLRSSSADTRSMDQYQDIAHVSGMFVGEKSAASREAHVWGDLSNLRLDFGIRTLPSGITFSSSSYLGQGHLFDLCQLPHSGGTQSERRRHPSITISGLEVPPQNNYEGLIALLPDIFDAILRHTLASLESCSGSSDKSDHDVDHLLTRVCQLLRYLNEAVSIAVAVRSLHDAHRLAAGIKSQTQRLSERLQVAGIGLNGASPGTLQSRSLFMWLLWFEIEVSWRSLAASATKKELASNDANAEDFIISCKELMLSLLSYGLHRTMRSVKAATAVSRERDSDGAGQSTPLYDVSAELWVCLIHLLQSASRLCGPCAEFWSILQLSLRHWLGLLPARQAILNAEAIWFSVFGLSALSQFSASNGTTLSRPRLGQCWYLLAEALSVIRLRYDSRIEQTMSSVSICRRDQYVRAIIQRCCNLISLWDWSAEGAEPALSKIFEIFNSHKLADLPSENDHDFPPFLRAFDGDLLYDVTRWESTAYHVFLKLLGLVARDPQNKATDTADASRRVSRLFSRLCPVRVMAFTKEHPPTSRERSSLFNHYAVSMLHLSFVPSAAPQRLRQIKSFLVFRDADTQSQVACIRAMMYAAVIHRHYDLDIAPIASWFSHIFDSVLRELQTVNHRIAVQDPGQNFQLRRQSEKCTGLLIAALRSIQHIVQHPRIAGMDGRFTLPLLPASEARYPELQLLRRAWTSDILLAGAAVDFAVGLEVLRCLQEFLKSRNCCLHQARESVYGAVAARPGDIPSSLADGLAPEHTYGRRNGQMCESQESFAELFEGDDIDFADPELDKLLGSGTGDASTSHPDACAVLDAVKAKDNLFAEEIRVHLSPALFALISNLCHPDENSNILQLESVAQDAQRLPGEECKREGKDVLSRNTRQRYLNVLIDCWAGCASVLVHNGLRDWSSYLNYGNESWKRIDDAIAKRDVALRFLHQVLSLDPTSAYKEHQIDFLQVWFHGLAALNISVQDHYTHALFLVVDPHMPWVRHGLLKMLGRSHERRLDRRLFREKRGELFTDIVEAMRADYECGSDCESGAGQNTTAFATLSQRRAMVFPCLSSFLSSMRVYVEALATREWAQVNFAMRTIENDYMQATQAYLAFCDQTLGALASRAGEGILRGVRGEMTKTADLVTSKRLQWQEIVGQEIIDE